MTSSSLHSNSTVRVILQPLLCATSDQQGTRQHKGQSDRNVFRLLDALDGGGAHEGRGGAVHRISVPNLTRPGEWRYESTPLPNFSWEHGGHVSMELSPTLGRAPGNLDELWGHRTAAALVGVVSCHDVRAEIRRGGDPWRRVEQEMERSALRLQGDREWGDAINAQEEDAILRRNLRPNKNKPTLSSLVRMIFVFDSFDYPMDGDEWRFDPTAVPWRTVTHSDVVAFPPLSDDNKVLGMHLSVVMHNLAVNIFTMIEQQIRHIDATIYDAIEDAIGNTSTSELLRAAKSAANLTLGNFKSVTSSTVTHYSAILQTPIDLGYHSGPRSGSGSGSVTSPRFPASPGSHKLGTLARNRISLRRRDAARRSKRGADLALLAGSPLDALQRYVASADMAKETADSVWYATCLQGQAAALCNMASFGGAEDRRYLDRNFGTDGSSADRDATDEGERRGAAGAASRLSLSVFSLMEECIAILSRHRLLAPAYADSCLHVARYVAFEEAQHQRGRWGHDPNIVDTTHVRSTCLSPADIERCGRVLDHICRAVSAGGLGIGKRAELAAQAAEICLLGVVSSEKSYTPMPRKAAFYSLVAAECASLRPAATPSNDGALERLQRRTQIDCFWRAAAYLYGEKENRGPSTTASVYGWASLRISVLHGLVLHAEEATVAEEAADQILTILSEITPEKVRTKSNSRALLPLSRESSIQSLASLEPREQGPDVKPTSGKPAPISRTPSKKTKTKSAFITSTLEALSLNTTPLMLAQAGWLQDDPVPSIELPIFPSGRGADLQIFLNDVAPKFLTTESCIVAQKKVAGALEGLRKDVPVQPNFAADDSERHRVPLTVKAAVMKRAAGRSLLEEVPEDVESTNEAQGAMSTFFNPYGEKKEIDRPPSMVADGELQNIEIDLTNHLSIDLEVSLCSLEFSNSPPIVVDSPPVSFIMPRCSKNFTIQLQFVVRCENFSKYPGNKSCFEFSLCGMRFFSMGRSYLIPFETTREARDKNIDVRLMAIPAVPKLHISSDLLYNSISEHFHVDLTDGETQLLPPFTLKRNSHVCIGRVQIYSCGIPSVSNSLIFDSDETCSLNLVNSSSFPFQSSLKICCSESDLSLKDLNLGLSSQISIRLEATADFSSSFSGDFIDVTLQFKYCGVEEKKNEVLRVHRIVLRILKCVGPSISSFKILPDFKLLGSLAIEQEGTDDGFTLSLLNDNPKAIEPEELIQTRIGVDSFHEVCSKKFSALVEIYNGFDDALTIYSNNLPDAKIEPKVSIKVLISLERISRSGRSYSDIIKELKHLTSINFRASALGRMREGTITIPSNCGSGIQFCEPPVSIAIFVDGNEEDFNFSDMNGRFIDVSAKIIIQEWVNHDILEKCCITFKFVCTPAKLCGVPLSEQASTNIIWCGQVCRVMKKENISVSNVVLLHKAKIAFMERGKYVLSACVKISNMEGGKEIWWVPKPHTITLKKS